MRSDARLYGAAIAVVSGVYSVWSAVGAPEMVLAAWAMAVIGAVVIVHGLVLLTGFVDRLGASSGPLMIGYAAVMLLVQVLLATGIFEAGGSPMSGPGMGGAPMTAGMGWDAGMVALAILMLASGLLMTRSAGADRGM